MREREREINNTLKWTSMLLKSILILSLVHTHTCIIHTYVDTYIHTYIHENNPNKNNIETVVCSGMCVCV